MAGLDSNTQYGTPNSPSVGNFSNLLKATRASSPSATPTQPAVPQTQFKPELFQRGLGSSSQSSWEPTKNMAPIGTPAEDAPWTPPQEGSFQRSLANGRGQYGVNPQTGKRARVLRVLDGDTIEVDTGDGVPTPVRYLGINAPEIPHSDKEIASETARPDLWAPGRKAETSMRSMLPTGSYVQLESDVTKVDKFGRPLFYAWGGEGSQAQSQLTGQVLQQQQGFAPYQFNGPSGTPSDIKYPGRDFSQRKLSKSDQQLLRSKKLSSAAYTVDHIVPLWADGTDNKQNRQIIDKTSYEKKTAIQSVPLTLFVNGYFKGTVEQQRAKARQMALSWEKRSTDGLPSLEEINANGGYIPLEDAKKIAEKWKADEIPSTWSLLKGSLSENMSGFMSPRFRENIAQSIGLGKEGVNSQDLSNTPMPVVGEFGKGFAGGLTAGMVPNTEASEESGRLGWWSNLAGNLVGMGIGLGKWKGVIGLNRTATGDLVPGSLQKLGSKIAQSYGKIGGAEKAAALTDVAISKVIRGIDVGDVKDAGKVGKWVFARRSIKDNAILFSTWGQLGLAGRELTKQEEFELSGHLSQAANDVLFGGLIGGATKFGGGQTIAGYSWVGGSMLSFELGRQAMAGEEPDIVAAGKNAMLMMGLHGMGFKKGLKDPRTLAIGDEAFKMALTTGNRYLPNRMLPQARKGQAIPNVYVMSEQQLQDAEAMRIAYSKKYKKDDRFQGLDPIVVGDTEATGRALHAMEQIARKEAELFYTKKLMKAGKITPEQVAQEIGDKTSVVGAGVKKQNDAISVAFNTLKTRALSPELREIKSQADLISMGEIMRMKIAETQVRPQMDSTKSFRNIQKTLSERGVPKELIEEYRDAEFPEGTTSIRGVGKKPGAKPKEWVNIDTQSRENINDLARNPDKYEEDLYIGANEHGAKVAKIINEDSIRKGETPPIENTESTLPIFARKKSGEYVRLGYVPEPRALDRTYEHHINKDYDIITARLREKIKNSETAVDLRKELNSDKSMKGRELSVTESEKIFKNKDKDFSDKWMYDKLKAPRAQTEHTQSTGTISAKMREHGIKFLVVSKRNVFAENDNAIPRSDPTNPYGDFKITRNDWLRSIAMQKGKTVQKNAPVGARTAEVVKERAEQGSADIPLPPEQAPDFMKEAPVETHGGTNLAKAGTISKKVKNLKKKIVEAREPTEPVPEAPVRPQEAITDVSGTKTRTDSKTANKAVMESTGEDPAAPKPVADDPGVLPPNESNKELVTNESERFEKKDDFDMVDTKAPPRANKFVIVKIGEEGTNEVAAHFIKDPKKQAKFTREALTVIAKKAAGGGFHKKQIRAGMDKFRDAFIKQINKDKDIADEYAPNANEIDQLNEIYVSMARGMRRNELAIENGEVTIRPGGLENMGQMDVRTREMNKKYGYPEWANEIVTINPNNDYAAVSAKPKEYVSGDVADYNEAKRLLAAYVHEDGTVARYLPVGNAGKGAHKTHFVRVHEELGDRVLEHPEQYLNKDASGKYEKFTGSESEQADARWHRAYQVDYQQVPKEMFTNKIMPRAGLIYNRNDVYLGEPKEITLTAVQSKLIGEIQDLKIDTKRFGGDDQAAKEAAVRSFHGGAKHDGPAYMTAPEFDQFISGVPGYRSSGNHEVGVKVILQAEIQTPEGPVTTFHKIHIMRMDKEIERDLLTDYPDLKIEKGHLISFDSNVKVGPKTGTWKIQLEDLYPITLSAEESVSRHSPSAEKKFISTDEGVLEAMTAEKVAVLKDLNQFIVEYNATKSGAEFAAVLDKWADRFPKLNTDEMFYGIKKQNFELGAGKIQLSHEIEKIVKNLFAGKVANPTYKRGTMVTIVAPIRGEYDGVGKGYRHPKGFSENPNEHPEVILGAKQMKDLKVKDGDLVKLKRDPSYNISNVVIAKVVTGNPSLGKQHGMVHPEVERLVLQGDQDGDTMHIVPVGKGGVSQAEANAIIERGRLSIPFEEVPKADSPVVTPRTMDRSIQDDHYGGDQTSLIAMAHRPHEEVVDNGIFIRINGNTSRNENAKSDYAIMVKNSDGELVVVHSGKTNAHPTNITLSPRDPQEDYSALQNIEKGYRQAVDSKKGPSIRETTKDDPNWALTQLWRSDIGDGKIDGVAAASLRGAMKVIQAPYNLKSELNNDMSSLRSIYEGRYEGDGLSENSLRYYRNMKRAGVTLTPNQEMHLLQSPKTPTIIAGELKEIKTHLSPEQKELLDFTKDPETIIAELEASGGKLSGDGKLSQEAKDIISRPGLILISPSGKHKVEADMAGGKAVAHAKRRGEIETHESVGKSPEAVRVTIARLKELKAMSLAKDAAKSAADKEAKFDRYSDRAIALRKKHNQLNNKFKEDLEEFNKRFLSRIEAGKYTQKDLDTLAYWVAIDPSGNMKYKKGASGIYFKDQFYTRRFESVMAQSPSVMRAYNAGAEAYNPKAPKVEEQIVEEVKTKAPSSDELGGWDKPTGGTPAPKPVAPKPVSGGTTVKIAGGTGHPNNRTAAAEARGEGINVLRKTGTNEHYGNPFSPLATANTAEVKVGSVKEAVSRYSNWLLGKADQDVRPEQRKWIQEQIKAGKLKNQTLLYYKDLGQESHADALAKIANAYYSKSAKAPKSETTPITPTAARVAEKAMGRIEETAAVEQKSTSKIMSESPQPGQKTLKLRRIISGAQSGADIAGLDAAKELGIETGGTAAAGHSRFTDTGAREQRPDITEKYGLSEGQWTEKPSKYGAGTYKDPWTHRTAENARNSDGTLWIGNDSPGKRLTMSEAKKAGKPIIINPTPKELRQWAIDNNIETLNVAGNREHTNVGVYEKTKDLLRSAFIQEDLFSPKSDGSGGPGIHDGKGGTIGDAWNGLKGMFAPMEYNAADYRPKATTTYQSRGVDLGGDNDMAEIARIVTSEASNRAPDRQQFEVQNILNTGINRSLTPGPDYGKPLVDVLQRRAQFQGYAPDGITLKSGATTTSQYQLLKQGKIDPGMMKRYQNVQSVMNDLKAGKLEDTTNGATFYVHAKDGTLWLGKTLKEAKDAANKHEKNKKLNPTKWGTAAGLPIDIAKL